ncbi:MULTISPECIES: restriction endonuclease subunit S [Bacillota]|nr:MULTISPECIES: restriction endonuclease subunit S [Bacillota]MDY2639323.1 restriction endonuclease subunit S [Ligilactobacillus salivarius]MDY5352417.1 restriction endonuclease subunit S [Lactobacillus johnsonii]MDY5436766.1 restriction endonuclease subunit S [Peptostreptococcus porci]
MTRKMKDSGIEWIGEIPEEWKIEPVFLHFWQRKAKNFQGREKNLLSLSYGKVIEKDINKLGGLLPASYNTYNIVEPGDIIIRPTDLQNDKKSLRTGLVKEHGIITSAYIDLAPRNKQNVSFFHYMLHAYDIEKVFYNMGNGVRQGLNYEELSKLRLVVPSSEEQKSISDFLDKKVSKINQTSKTIQQEIDALEEYRKSLITETVTKGLDKTVPMKDSGIEWIGEIPEEWNLVKGKYLFKLRTTKGNTKNVQLLSPTQNFGVIPQELYEKLTGMRPVKLKSDADLQQMRTIYKGDYCISLRSFQGGFEYSKYDGVVSPAYQVFYPYKKINSTYYRYLFKDSSFIQKINSFTMSLRDGKNIAFSDFGNIDIPFPTFVEQNKIAKFLDKKLTIIDQIIRQKQQQLNHLDKYKQSIIYEYVTGKKQVPEKEGVKNAQ